MSETLLIASLLKSPQATGCDVSKFNIKWSLDKLISSGLAEAIDFIIIRCGYAGSLGSNVVDPLFFEFFEQALTVRASINPDIQIGTYWYPTVHVEWEKQRDFLLGKILEVCGGELDFTAFDIEKAYNIINGQFAVATGRFMKYIRQDYPWRKHLVYTNKYIYQELKTLTNQFDEYPYWHAQYPYNDWLHFTTTFMAYMDRLFELRNTAPALPSSKGPNDWEIWQIGANTGVGDNLGFERTHLDICISRRTHGEFIKWVHEDNLDSQLPPPPPPDFQIPEAVYNELISIGHSAESISETLRSL